MHINSFNIIFFGLALAINDLISFGITKDIFLKNYFKNIYWLAIPAILYSFQIGLFYLGLSHTSMSVLNLTWNLFSIISVTLLGIFYFNEEISSLKTLAVVLAILSIFIFTLDGYKKK